MLIGKLESVDITTKQARGDADVLIVETAIEESEHHRTAVIVGEAIDLLVILIGRTQTHQEVSTKLNKPVQLANLPPTSAAAHQHINRVYYQVQTWLGNDLKPPKWGWILLNEFLEPITAILSPAPDELLNTIFCNCKNSRGSRCGCRKSGLQCSSACGQCNGQACFNASRYESDLDEDCTFDPEILQDLETNILDDENNEKKLKISE
ncbi:uncharacterized protein TNIN_441451 [Trichonephila inaurata madagascariensis]|uniref:Tesmin/TSO1-like CXC domain-containing protein n=1 Tax=Trichonephila inaurata madagascariensis TaxID=2747483 RepID=A0A8X6XJ12_9ARAC|nr:uncharacterized protein TNIN_441451 [Trichonephila inaurata madagascariensis]